MTHFVNRLEKQIFEGNVTRCPMCNKHICISHKTRYAYRSVNKNGYVRYFCSWRCFNEGCTKISKHRRVEN